MASIGQRLQRSAQAALNAWNNGDELPQGSINYGVWNGLDSETAERFERYVLLWKYYKGEHKKHLRPRSTPSGMGPDDNVIVNLSRRVVNKGAAFLFGEPLEWEISGANEQAALDMLALTWRSPEWKMAFFNELAINGGVTGDYYLQLVPPTMAGQAPRIINLDPCVVVPTYNESDFDQIFRWDLLWRSGGQLKRQSYVLMDTGLSWEIVTELFIGGRWVADPATPPDTWDYTWAPIFHGKNLPNPNCYFGLSDLDDADLNDAINQTVSNLNRIVRIFAHPVIWGKMFTQSDLDVSKVSLSSKPDAMLGALELAKDVSGAQGYADFLSTEFSEVTQVPGNDPQRMSIGAQSGFALRVLFHELTQKTYVKRALYGKTIVDVSQRALELAGMGENTPIKLHWRSPLPVDLNEQVNNDKFELDYGLASRETISARRGYNYTEERERMQQEQTTSQATQNAMLQGLARMAAGNGAQ